MGNTRAPMMITMLYFEMLFCIKAKVLNVQELLLTEHTTISASHPIAST